MDNKTIYTVRNIYGLIHQANKEMFMVWKSGIAFSWQWWVEVVLSVIPWILWIVFRKRDSTGRLLCAGFLVVIISSWFDFLGTCLGLWYYPAKLLPTVPSYVVYDFTLIPVIIMSLLQFRPNINPFLKGGIFAGVTSFVGEPIFEWLNMYCPLYWRHIYSLPVYCGIYVVAHYVSRIKTYANL